MKKIASIFSVFALSAAITACGTADVNDLDPGYDRHIYDVNYNDVDDVYDGGRNRTIYTNRTGNMMRSSGGIEGYGNPMIVQDPDNYQGFDDQDIADRTRTLTR